MAIRHTRRIETNCRVIPKDVMTPWYPNTKIWTKAIQVLSASARFMSLRFALIDETA